MQRWQQQPRSQWPPMEEEERARSATTSVSTTRTASRRTPFARGALNRRVCATIGGAGGSPQHRQRMAEQLGTGETLRTPSWESPWGPRIPMVVLPAGLPSEETSQATTVLGRGLEREQRIMVSQAVTSCPSLLLTSILFSCSPLPSDSNDPD